MIKKLNLLHVALCSSDIFVQLMYSLSPKTQYGYQLTCKKCILYIAIL